MTRIYEDMALGNLSRERYQKMAEGYEAEQANLNNEIIGLGDWVATREEMDSSIDQFTALVEKYVDISELTPTIVNEVIKKIIVYAPEKQGTKRIQKVRIIFNFLDELDMPEIGNLLSQKLPMGAEDGVISRSRRLSAALVPYYLLPLAWGIFQLPFRPFFVPLFLRHRLQTKDCRGILPSSA